VMRPVDKSPAPMDHRGILSRAPARMPAGGQRSHLRKRASIMVQIVSRGDSFIVRLACTVCGERCRLSELWLGFPPGEFVQGQWVHDTCVSGKAEATFGSKRIVLMRGSDALRRVAESLDDGAADPVLARQRPRVRAKA
jgi:hypothetical protein